MANVVLTYISVPAIEARGLGYLAGEPPDSPDPDAPDGRFKILNVPSRGRVVVYDRRNMQPVRSTVSASDGTWRVEFLDPNRYYIVIGFDDRMLVNAAIQDWIKPELMA